MAMSPAGGGLALCGVTGLRAGRGPPAGPRAGPLRAMAENEHGDDRSQVCERVAAPLLGSKSRFGAELLETLQTEPAKFHEKFQEKIRRMCTEEEDMKVPAPSHLRGRGGRWAFDDAAQGGGSFSRCLPPPPAPAPPVLRTPPPPPRLFRMIHRPPLADRHPPSAKVPTAVGSAPTGLGCAPTADGYAPPADGYAPTADGYAPTADGYAPPAVDELPPAVGSLPPAVVEPPTDIDPQPV